MDVIAFRFGFSRSHTLAWERIGDAPASRNPQKKLDAGASRIGSHAGASLPLSFSKKLKPRKEDLLESKPSDLDYFA
jgi:hypothetical protein